MGWKIEVTECCGSTHCARAWETEQRFEEGRAADYHERVSSEKYNRIQPEWDAKKLDFVETLEGRIAQYKGRLEALKELLQTLMLMENLSQEEIDALLQKWLDENPDPELEVSKALEAVGQPIPVTLPQKEKVKIAP